MNHCATPGSAVGRWICLVATMLMLAVSGSSVAQMNPSSSRDQRRAPPVQARLPGTPLLAIVSLGDQHVTIYDAGGKALQSPISTGAAGYETPAGIFSVVQKKEMHQSNLYEDGPMPFMQRITWTGIALHAGVLPGRPASHGCIRMPMAFAERLFGLTNMGLRVIVVRDDIAPADIAHPLLFVPDPAPKLAPPAPPPKDPGPIARRGRIPTPASASATQARAPSQLDILKVRADALQGEAEIAARGAKDARQNAVRKGAEAAAAARALRTAETNHANAEKSLKDVERALPAPAAAAAAEQSAEQTSPARTKAQDRLAAAAAQLQTAREQAEARKDAAERSSEAARLADATRDAAVEAASAAARKLQPVSVFVSRKAQRFYVRQANEPIYEGPVTIQDPDKPIGSFVFTAVGDVGGGDIRWNVVSMYAYSETTEPIAQPPQRRGETRRSGPIPAAVASAKAALDRIAIPRDVVAGLFEVVLPGSSFIVSDEAASIETGKDTDFVLIMSGEPQGALKVRPRESLPRNPNEYSFGSRRPRNESPFFFFWN